MASEARPRQVLVAVRDLSTTIRGQPRSRSDRSRLGTVKVVRTRGTSTSTKEIQMFLKKKEGAILDPWGVVDGVLYVLAIS